MKLTRLSLGVAWGTACLLSACGDRAGDPSAPASKNAVVVADALDRAVHFNQSPRRIAIAGKASFMIENAIHLFPEAREKGVDFLSLPVDAVMTVNPQVIHKEKLAAEGLHKMEEHRPHPITVLPVTDDEGKAIGMIHITDLLKQGVM